MDFTRYEKARIIGARALQIAMDAPLLLKVENEKLEEIKYDPLKIAEMEFESGVLPITVKRPFPKKIEMGLRRDKEDEEKDETEEKKEQQEEKEIKDSGEIMELATPEDEVEEASGGESEEGAI
ncbi:DNA-directed RNA polymerase subunit K [Candidatus Pacearchaeota archaeon]|nr:DNA-directed RNA polymerase subunit K [Candidatus Pacearchaeota archaeon]